MSAAYKQATAALMLTHGGVAGYERRAADGETETVLFPFGQTETVEFGSRPHVTHAGTLEAYNDFMEHGVNVEETSDPGHEFGYGFVDSFTSNETFRYIECEIVSNSGSRWTFVTQGDVNFPAMVKLLVRNSGTDIDAALAALEKRLDDTPLTFEFGCSF